MCAKHGKKIEAFCREDRWVLCITWILNDNHKAHTLSNTEDAYK